MNRALRAATMGALLLAPVALTACSAGQVSQTLFQERDNVGPSAQIGDLELRQVLLSYPGAIKEDDPATPEDESTFYEQGDDAELTFSIVNRGREDDTLVGIEGAGFDGVFVGEPPAEEPPVSPTTPAAPESPEAPTGQAPAASEQVSIDIPGQQALFIGPQEGFDPISPDSEIIRIFLADLAAPLTPSQSLTITLIFENAGELTVDAVVSGPTELQARGEAYDFYEGDVPDEVAPGGGNPAVGD